MEEVAAIFLNKVESSFSTDIFGNICFPPSGSAKYKNKNKIRPTFKMTRVASLVPLVG